MPRPSARAERAAAPGKPGARAGAGPTVALPSSTRTFFLVVMALAVALLIAHALSFRFVVDDAYISFRYARNLLDGHGLVFNPGDPVEGYSNLLWVLLSALGMAAGLDPLLWARILGVLAAAGTLALLPGAVRRLAPEVDARLARSGGLLTVVLSALSGPIACWSLAGLETPLFMLLTVAAWRLALDRRALAAGTVGVLLVLTRPEGVALAAAFAGWAALPAQRDPGEASAAAAAVQPSLFRRAGGVLLLAAGIVAHLLWRHATYGEWLPNTYFAKTGDLGGQLRTGLPYAGSFLLHFVVPWAVVVAWLLACGRRRWWGSVELRRTLLVIALWTAYMATVGGDMLGMFRFAVSILPLVIASGAALLAYSGGERAGSRAVPYAETWIAALLAGLMLAPSFMGHERRLVTAHMSLPNLGGWRLAGEGLAAQNLPPGTTIALCPVGYIPYRTGFRTYDILGITDRHIAHRKMAFTQGYAGHEKHDGAYILDQRPDYLLLGNVDVTDRPRTSPMRPFARELDIFQDPRFVKEYVPVYFALPDGKYLNCFKRRDLP